ncbi:MAG: hypothetical protein VW625_04585 [Perlucidibaca sp.]
MRLLSLLALASALTLSACATMTGEGQASSQSGSQVASPSQTQQFMTAVEAKRGSALTLAEKIQLQGLTGAARLSMDNAQNSFLDKIGSQVGLNGAVLASLFPEAGKPVSQSAAVQRLQSKLGKPLSAADTAAVKAATALRNNSVDGLKTSLANGIGARVGMDGQVILALMPMLGF